MPEKQEVEKPWVVYNCVGPLGIGKVIKDYGNSVEIKYSEGQLFPLQLWSSKNVNRFNTSSEAIDYFLNKNKDYTKTELEKRVNDDFPSARTLPKCTGSQKLATFMGEAQRNPNLGKV